MKNSPEISSIFICKKCDYKCSKKSDYNKHLLTSKHKNRTELNNLEQNVAKNRQIFICKKCNKEYRARNSLWYHEKQCITNNTKENNDKDLIMILINENKDFKQLLLEMCKEKDEYKTMMLKVIENGTNNINCNNNSHNKTFNLQFFLNETCKDAMNIMDFIDSIKLQLTDLERVGEIGYVEGISNIIVKNLKELDITQRPVHCTDKKRETLYVKDENKWEKDETKQKMHKLVKRVASKNARLLPKFKEAHPDCSKSVSKFSDQYNKIIVESMGGSGDNDFEKEEKIIAKISKEILVEK